MSGWIWWLGVGIVSVAAGILALANPLAATLTAGLLTGYMFIAVGLLMLLSVFGDPLRGSRLLSVLMGLAMIFIGYNIISRPLQGVLSLTVLVAAMMVVIGGLRIALALAMAASGPRIVLVLSGMLSILLGVMIFSNFPYSAAVVLGVLLAIELLSNGASLIAVALARRSAKAEVRP